MVEIITDIASVLGSIMTIIAFLSLLLKPTRKKIEEWIRNVTGYEETKESIENHTQSINTLKANSEKADKQILSHMQKIDTRLDKLDKRVLENERDRIKAELSEYASRCARGIKIYPEEMTHINEIYYKYHEILGCNSFGTKMYDIIVKYYENQEWIKT
jgi:hypothetical protein